MSHTAQEKELIEFLESFEHITITADVARDFFNQAKDIDTDLHDNINQTLTEIIDVDSVIKAQKCRDAALRKQLLAIELDTPMMVVVREKVRNELYDLRIYDEE